MQILTDLMSIISRGVVFAGSVYTIWNAVQLGFALKEHQGPETKQSLLGIAGGIVVITAAAFLTQVQF